MKEIYQIKKVHPEVYQIMEAGLDAMYVICEEKQAVLMDAGTGIGNLEACVRRLTEMPFKVCVTHGHRDHFGGAGQFSEVYMAQEDWEDACAIDAKKRRDYVNRMIAACAVGPELLEQADIQEWDRKPRLHSIKDGDVICAGNWKLEVLAVPGHTDGFPVIVQILSWFFGKEDAKKTRSLWCDGLKSLGMLIVRSMMKR